MGVGQRRYWTADRFTLIYRTHDAEGLIPRRCACKRDHGDAQAMGPHTSNRHSASCVACVPAYGW